MTQRTAALVALIGGALMAIGSFMPWVSARTGLGSVTVTGTDGDGVFSLALGAIVALIALVHLDRLISVGMRLAIGAGGLVGIVIAWIDIQAVNERIERIDSDLVAASVGAGLYILAIGSAIAVLGGIQMDSGSIDGDT